MPSQVMNISTNALIASLRAISHETVQVNQKLSSGDEDEELSMYLSDLHCAVAELSELYQIRASADESLTNIDILLNCFASETI